jgi:hypothetical protein
MRSHPPIIASQIIASQIVVSQSAAGQIIATQIVARRKRVFLLFVCLLLAGCRIDNSPPAISFSKVPVADLGGPDKTDTIEGRVTGVKPGQQIVLYAKSDGLWWVQPFSDHPFTTIQNGSRWHASTHLGTEYAALLVNAGFTPPETAEILPSPSAGVVTVAVIKGQGPQPVPIPLRTIHFSGYDWTVRSAASFRGGSLNWFDPANAWTDERGALHLRIARSQNSQNGWTCAEVRLTRSLGYGTYVFVVRDSSQLEPSAVLTLFTWDEQGTEQSRRELDIEISRWGYRQNENAHYVVQPYYVPANVDRFVAPAGVLTHSFRWKLGEATFSTYKGSGASAGHLVNQHVFSSGVPPAGRDSVHLNLYIFGKGEIPLKDETEVVIEKFEYLP